MDAFLVSTGIVALAEIGDKTQLLAFILAAKFRKPVPIVIETLRWVLGVSFIVMALWTLVPDKFDEKDAKLARFGVFTTTLIAFFLAEMGDKTQLATIALAAQYQAVVQVVAGTTLGMMIANVPAVLLGERIAERLPVRTVHFIAAALFAVLGVATLLGAGKRFGF